ncbi:MAG: hypothetical protein HYY18_12880 [Planctomycetes bacterium]|nr:hypothetical protein [Planctomycetota bacterium]
MTILEFLIFLLVAAIIGSIGQSIAGYSHGGCLTSIAVGLVGAIFGTAIARTLGLPELFTLMIGGVAFPLAWSIIGASLFVAVVAFLARPLRSRA